MCLHAHRKTMAAAAASRLKAREAVQYSTLVEVVVLGGLPIPQDKNKWSNRGSEANRGVRGDDGRCGEEAQGGTPALR